MQNRNEYTYTQARNKVREMKCFYNHAMRYLIAVPLLLVFNYYTTDFPWVLFPAIGWGLGLLGHGLKVFGKNWEERQVQKLMDRVEF